MEERRLYFFSNRNSDFSLLPTALEKVYVCNSFRSQPQMQSQNPRMESISYHTCLLSFKILPSVVIPLLRNNSEGVTIMRLLSDRVFFYCKLLRTEITFQTVWPQGDIN